jgi:HSP20 family protein
MFDFGRAFDMQQEMQRYLQHVARAKRPIAVFSRSAWQPAVDVYETQDSVVALIDLPGVTQEEIDLVVGRNSLVVRGQRAVGADREGRTYSCIEIPFGPFERTIQFAAPVDPDGAKATYTAGFLEVVMPKAQPAGPRRVSVREG